ncbi:MAG: acetoin utilization protein AcuC [Actinomycetales bacterium]|nr:acetoin utilization protein AcuC [Actinomycetales bacterium]
MSDSVGVVWDDRLAEYDFGPGHPLAPVRVQLAMRLAAEFGLFAPGHVSLLTPVEPADEAAILRVHEAGYVEAVRRASSDPHFYDAARGLGTDDDPVFPDMHRAASRVAGASLLGARAIHSGEVQHAVNLAGGLHHALPGAAEGFCVYNDIAVAIAWLLDQGVERVAYVDVDVHHGDGVQAIFWDDPRVLTISIHESPASLFPGSGWPGDIGGPGAVGSAVNVALPAGTGDQGWLRALHGVVPDLLEAFRPQVLVTQQGVDSHFEDPLAHLLVSVDGQRMAFEALHRWAHRYADGRWLALGGGGYEWVNVVPRAWTHLIAEATGRPIRPDTEVPESFHAFVLEALGRQAPGRMTDGREPWPRPFDQGFDPADSVDAAILATREAVFPHYGLTAEPGLWF